MTQPNTVDRDRSSGVVWGNRPQLGIFFWLALTGLTLWGAPLLGQADWYVTTSGSDSNNGQSWSTAFATIQKAVTSAIQFGGYEIWVGEGRYVLSSGIVIPATGTRVPIQLIGGFGGDEISITQQDWVEHPTIIDGNGVVESVITVWEFVDLIDGFTITGGSNGYLGTGGAVDIRGCGSAPPQPVLRNLVIRGNGGDTSHTPAYYEGGGMYIEDCSPWIVNASFSDNRVWAHGGALFARDSDDSPIDTYPTVVNSTFSGNHSDVNGGAVGSYRGSLTIVNSILWGDVAGDGATHEAFGSTLNISYSDIDSSQPGFDGVDGNIQVDPLLAGAGRYHIRDGSPCIDSGNDLAVPGFLTTDFDGDDRFIDGATGASGGTVDMGADEYVPGSFSGVWYVDGDAGPAGDGLSWATAFQTMPVAVAAAVDGEEIWVAEGTYPALVTIDEDLSLYGGFNGTETSLEQRDWTTYQSVIDGENVRQCMEIIGGDVTVDGFTITRGKETIYQDGAVYVHPNATAVRFANSSFVANTMGGALYVVGTDVEVDRCKFEGNTSSMGGAIALADVTAFLTVTDSVFSGNLASPYDGGAIASSHAVVKRSRFFDNEGRWGGAISGGTGTLWVENCEFSGNVARERGGAVYGSEFLSDSTIINSTFFGNSAGTTVGYGGALQTWAASTDVVGSILWGNSAPSFSQIGGGGFSVAYSDVDQAGYGEADGSQDANGNIRLDPLFTDADGADDIVGTTDDDLTLQAGSPAIDAGDSTALVFGSVDLAGSPRHNDDPGVDDTGYGPEPMIDMGAHERQASTPDAEYELTMSVVGSGTTTPGAGVHTYPGGELLTISADPSSGWIFTGWTGWVADPNSATTTVAMNWDRSVTANFNATYSVTVDLQGDGTGSVTSTPAGIDCPGDCSESFDVGTSVSLSVAADPGTVFDGWLGGGCSGTGSCDFSLIEDVATVALCNLEGACGLGNEMTIDNVVIDGSEELEACSTITLGDGVVIEPPSHVVLRSGSMIVLGNGFSVLEGATLTIEIYPDVGLEPAISVTKVADPSTASEGDSITYTISVENNGEVPLTEVAVADAKCDASPVYQSGDDGDAVLEVGETWIYACSGSAESATFVNTATATFRDLVGNEVSDSGTAEVTVTVSACASGNRFADLGDGTVLDCNTSLVWLKDASCNGLMGEYGMSWSDAMTYTALLAHGYCGLTDGSSSGQWRVPVMAEMCGSWPGTAGDVCVASTGLVNPAFSDPAISDVTGVLQWTEGDPFVGVENNYYWTATEDAQDSTKAWSTGVWDGKAYLRSKGFNGFFWPVREME